MSSFSAINTAKTPQASALRPALTEVGVARATDRFVEKRMISEAASSNLANATHGAAVAGPGLRSPVSGKISTVVLAQGRTHA